MALLSIKTSLPNSLHAQILLRKTSSIQKQSFYCAGLCLYFIPWNIPIISFHNHLHFPIRSPKMIPVALPRIFIMAISFNPELYSFLPIHWPSIFSNHSEERNTFLSRRPQKMKQKLEVKVGSMANQVRCSIKAKWKLQAETHSF